MRELSAKATKARKAMLTEAVAISVNSSFPQFDCQSSTRVAADDDAEMRRYASTCKVNQHHKSTMHYLSVHKSLASLELRQFNGTVVNLKQRPNYKHNNKSTIQVLSLMPTP